MLFSSSIQTFFFKSSDFAELLADIDRFKKNCLHTNILTYLLTYLLNPRIRGCTVSTTERTLVNTNTEGR